jgi:small subunit ribosomal protein S9
MADEESTPQEPDTEPAEEQPSNADAAAEQPLTVPAEEATEISSVTEDAAPEADEEAQEQQPTAPEPVAETPTVEETGVEQPVAQEPRADQPAGVPEPEDEEDEEPAPREKPAVPGAHLEVDIVPEGADPLGREEFEDPYAIEEDDDTQAGDGEDALEQDFPEPISTAAIDLAADARYHATGKRKTAIARVILRPGSGTYLVNGRALEEHFPRLTLQRNIRQPLETVGYHERMDVVARLHGGGISAQAGALRHGVSRALLEADPNLRGELKRRGFLTRDSRAKERKKAGLKKARKRPQFSKR